MNKVKFLSAAVSCCALALALGCEDNVPTNVSEPQGRSTINREIAERPGGGLIENGSGNSCPYPEIIHQVFDPEDLYEMKSLVWRITWPECYDAVDEGKVPTVFLPNGALHSFNYLNNVDPQNTFNSVFSLYHDNTIMKTADMGDVLVYAVNPPAGSMESVEFRYNYEHPPSIEHLQFTIETAPGGIVHYFLDGDNVEVDEWEYKEGDILTFKLSGPDYTRYGAIWIASMSPRIIDVYMTAKNPWPIDDISR